MHNKTRSEIINNLFFSAILVFVCLYIFRQNNRTMAHMFYFTRGFMFLIN